MNPIDHPILLLCAGLIALNAWQWVRGRKDRAAINEVLSQERDGICWMDIYAILGNRVGRQFNPKKLPRWQFEENCQRYARHVYENCPYKPVVTT